jgi:uncharacterized membrane protein YcaP (DUF421 family)
VFALSLPIWEFAVRAVVVYLFLLLLLRLGGKRQLGQFSPFDFALVLVVSNALQNSMNGGDNSLVGGMISAAVLVGLNLLIAQISRRNRKAERLLEGVPRVLIHNGRIYESMLRQENIAREEMETALREAGATDVSEVHFAVLETDGRISSAQDLEQVLDVPAQGGRFLHLLAHLVAGVDHGGVVPVPEVPAN